ncbi:MAG: polysaccharide biosynthesis/export family protein [Planctomycetia bacterium]|nr:polysaccharide biosynthesis/export family protein [Planctomycetia bacterium]
MRVSIEGTISFPLIGDVPVAGLTPFQLEKKLEQLLSEGYLVNPNVSVVVGEYHGSVHVFGQVKNPGVIKLVDKDVTVVEAISMSGGFTDIASPNRTYIIRKENGVDKTIYVKVNKVIKGKKGKGIILKPDDVVVVPEAFLGRTYIPYNGNENEEIHLLDYLKIIQKRKWIVIICFVVVVVFITIKTFKTTPVFQATSSIVLERKEINVGFQQVVTENQMAMDFIQTSVKL